MKNYQRGFSVIEIVIVLAVVAVLGGVGWIAYQRLMPKPAAQSAQPAKVASTDCSKTGTFTNATSDTIQAEKWNVITTKTVDLPGMQLSFTIPDSLVGKATCRATSSGPGLSYAFSTTGILSDVACETNYYQAELDSPYVTLLQLSATMTSQGQGSNVEGDLSDYLKANKAADGNYFTLGERRYYQFGDFFYVVFSDNTFSKTTYHDARVAACKDGDPDFSTAFATAFQSVRANTALAASIK